MPRALQEADRASRCVGALMLPLSLLRTAAGHPMVSSPLLACTLAQDAL